MLLLEVVSEAELLPVHISHLGRVRNCVPHNDVFECMCEEGEARGQPEGDPVEPVPATNFCMVRNRVEKMDIERQRREWGGGRG